MQMAGVSEKEASIQVGCTPEVMRRHYERLDGMAIARRNSERRLAVSEAGTIQLHAAALTGAFSPSDTPIDATANQLQTAIA